MQQDFTRKTKIFFKGILRVIKKELLVNFFSSYYYISLTIFLIAALFLFLSSIVRANAVVVDPLFSYFPWLFMFFIPVVLGGKIVNEKKEGTLEFYLAQPISELQFLIGKFMAGLISILIAVVLTLPSIFILSKYGELDMGQIFGQYLAVAFLAFSLVALVIFTSSLAKNQITSILLSVFLIFILMIIGYSLVTDTVPLTMAKILERLSFLPHYESMNRGVLDLRDALYFIGLGLIFLTLAYLPLIKNKFSKKAKIFQNLKLIALALIVIEISVVTLGEKIPGRIDFTSKNLYTLSKTTKDIIGSTEENINITVYASSKLPAQMEPVMREVKDILRDYKIYGGNRLVLQYKYPDQDEDIEKEAQRSGVMPFQFNLRTNDELSAQKGYLGINISYLDESESLSFVSDPSNLEYQITSLIAKMTTEEKKKIAVVSNGVKYTAAQGYSLFVKELSKQFEVVPFDVEVNQEEQEANQDLEEGQDGDGEEEAEELKEVNIPEDAAALIIPGAVEEFSQVTKQAIKDYLDNGGSVLALVDNIEVNQPTLTAAANPNSLADFFKDYGLEVKNNLVYDLKYNEMIQVGGGGTTVNFLTNYPFWLRAGSQENSSFSEGVDTILLTWASSVKELEDKIGDSDQVEDVIITSDFAGENSGQSYNISPNRENNILSEENLKSRVLAKSLVKEIGEAKNMRLILVGDADLLSDQIVQNSPGNLGIGLNMTEWLSNSQSLAEIRKKERTISPLVFEEKGEATWFKYGNILLVCLMVGGLGGYIIYRRNKKSKQKFDLD
jgi:ABC-2 type transport system permease protein